MNELIIIPANILENQLLKGILQIPTLKSQPSQNIIIFGDEIFKVMKLK